MKKAAFPTEKTKTSEAARRVWARRFAAASAVLAVLTLWAAALCRTATEPRAVDGVLNRAAIRSTLDERKNWETARSLRPSAENVASSRRVRAAFGERLIDGATEFLARNGDDAAARRTVAVGLARWGVERATATRVFSAFESAAERDAAQAVFSRVEAFDFAAEREASRSAARRAADVFSTLKRGGEFDENAPNDDFSGIDAALDFLRELDGESSGAVETASEPFVVAFDWTSGNPLDSAGIFAATDFVEARTDAALTAENALETAAIFFFLTTFGAFGTFNVAPTCRELAEFCRALNAARRIGTVSQLLLTAPFATFFAPRRFETAAEFAFAANGVRLRN